MFWRSWKSAPPDAGEDDPQAEPAAAGAEGIEDAEDTAEPPAFPPPLPAQVQFFGRPHPRTGKPRGLPEVDEPVPDTVLDQADFDGLTVRAASIRGDDHRWYGKPRQDSMGFWALPRAGAEDVLVACVADGVGSEQLSHVGSMLACRLLRRELAAYAEGAEGAVDLGDDADLPDLGQRICDRVRLGMLEHAEVLGPDPRALSTTLVGAVIELAPPGRPRRCVLLRVGDSSAYLLRDGAFRDCLADPHGEETIVSSATAALPTGPAAVEVAEVAIGNDDVLLLCSDGLANPMRGPEVQEKLVDYWSGPIPGALEFGWQLSFRAKSYGDDRTAICVWGR
ncbi:MAG TPA: protein phosphatase 2C domain-containing protein [Streptosporangiaceae bacterium]